MHWKRKQKIDRLNEKINKAQSTLQEVIAEKEKWIAEGNEAKLKEAEKHCNELHKQEKELRKQHNNLELKILLDNKIVSPVGEDDEDRYEFKFYHGDTQLKYHPDLIKALETKFGIEADHLLYTIQNYNPRKNYGHYERRDNIFSTTLTKIKHDALEGNEQLSALDTAADEANEQYRKTRYATRQLEYQGQRFDSQIRNLQYEIENLTAEKRAAFNAPTKSDIEQAEKKRIEKIEDPEHKKRMEEARRKKLEKIRLAKELKKKGKAAREKAAKGGTIIYNGTAISF